LKKTLSSLIRNDIVKLLKQNGFFAIGFSAAAPVDLSWQKKFIKWIENKNHNELKWLERNIEKRFNPLLLYPETRTIISVLHPWPEMKFDETELKIAAYAHGADYHNYLKEQAKPALQLLSNIDSKNTHKFITDSSAVFDRYWAWKAGLGFIGKNGFLINPEIGSRVIIGHIFTSIEFEPDNDIIENKCANCSNCLKNCPTNAFNLDGTIDARKCIACYTIENCGEIPSEISDKNPGWIFGCDICQQVCPFNKKEFETLFSQKMKGNWQTPATANEWLNMTEPEFEKLFADTPLKRAGLNKIKSNILALINQ
jgi:epoxyqueuosine reductase